MSDTGQADIIAFLAAPDTFGVPGPVEMIATHASFVFLVGDRAYKLKRAVKLPYLDFSTPALREAACIREFRLNKAAAPEIYRGVRRITLEPSGRPGFDGNGPLADTVVEMARFSQEAILDRIAGRGGLTADLQEQLAATIADFHAVAQVVGSSGGAEIMARVVELNRTALEACGAFARSDILALDTAMRRQLDRHAAALDFRARDGKVRRCHGDLHLRNICLIDGEPRLFDCLDFSEELATIDVLYDLAFLLMDLWQSGLRREANIIANRYCDFTGECEGYALLGFFMAVRATVRAHVEVVGATQTGEAKRLAAARAYFDLAGSLLQNAPARLIAIGGYSGSGKTTVAEALAFHLPPPPGARILETDRIRKTLHGVAPWSRLPRQAYAPEVSRAVYEMQADQSARLVAAGSSVVAGAVFDRPGARTDVAAAAGAAMFCGVWLTAAPDVLAARIGSRAPGASDATADVLEQQLRNAPGDLSWAVIDVTDGGPKTTVETILRRCHLHDSDCGDPPAGPPANPA